MDLISGTGYPSDALLDEFDATLLMLGRQMAARHAQKCEGASVTGPKLLALRLLDEFGRAKVGELASLLGIKAPAMTSLVDGLVRDGLVERQEAPVDRRVTLIALTDAGRAALHEAEQVRRSHLRDVLSALTEDDVRTLIRIQSKIIGTMVEREDIERDAKKLGE